MSGGQPYPAYRDSGIPWLGEIPAHWELSPLFIVMRERQEKNTNNREQNLLSLSYGKIINKDINSSFGLLPESFETYQIVVPGNIILRLTDLQNDKRSLRTGLVYERGIITSAYTCLEIFGDLVASFAHYLLHGYDLLKVFYTLGAGVRQTMKFEDLKRLPILLPSKEEQRAIAAFLDRQTAKIDALIAKKQRLLALLAEQRAALISHAVTKGLNPDVRMKDSGVAWLGEVPEGWEISKLGYVSESLQTGPFGSQIHSSEYISGGIPLINPAHIRNGKIYPSQDCAVDQGTWHKLSRHELIEGDIVFARRGEMGRCALVAKTETGWLCGTGSIRLRPDHSQASSQYLSWTLSTKGISEYLSLVSVGTTMDNLNTKLLSSVPLPVPPLDEQKKIADYLDQQTNRLANLVTKVETAIARLGEYRAALISAAVTGKIDTTGIAGHELLTRIHGLQDMG